jgi:hypothetical protein
MRYWSGYWWCRHQGCTGQGNTMEEAWDDMWKIWKEAFRPEFNPKTWEEFYYMPNPKCG